ncbi:MAG TPA: amidohydrolase family protein [Streptosporangiaceae bacterium]|nr:amidohydrolase family protein [Streptosporangiaceae bacterium]
MRVITLEEHFWTDALTEGNRTAQSAAASVPRLGALADDLRDLGPRRLADMDAAGIDVQVLSVAAPAAQELDAASAVRLARDANDRLAAAVGQHPDRFAGFATLPTPDPDAAAAELERTVTGHGFKGALINGHTGGRFLDDEKFWPIFERAEALAVPIYLHPTYPTAQAMEVYYQGFEESVSATLATSGWGWHAETGLHVLRIILGGVFDQFPGLQMIVGHMGENLPFSLARADERLTPVATGLKRRVGDYFRDHFNVTTSGYFTDPPLLCALMVLGADRILFSVDYPFASNGRARAFLDAAPISEADREKIAHGNAERLLGL